MKINTTELVISAVRRSQYPEDKKAEFLLVGRSNVGKSSFINTITGRKKLARTSSTPGKTRNLNFYLLNDLLFVKWLNWTTILFKNLTYGYIISRILATGIGLILNYIFRKKFIFK